MPGHEEQPKPDLTELDIEKHIQRPTYGEDDWFPRYAGEKYIDPRSEFMAKRAERVRESLGSLLLAHYEENPHARWSAASVVQKLAEETGIARALITGHLQEFSDSRVPLVEEGPTISWGLSEGSHFIQVVPTENSIQDLREL